jgi:hypothetical protein
MSGFGKLSLLTGFFLAAFCAAQSAKAAKPPADLCSLLSAADVSRIVGKPFKAPESSVAPRPYQNTNAGTDCNYSPGGAGNGLLFRIYVDNSPAQSTELHARLKMFYSPAIPAPGAGDEAYIDPSHAIHVRKGKVRYYLNLGDDAAAEKPVKALAELIARKL